MRACRFFRPRRKYRSLTSWPGGKGDGVARVEERLEVGGGRGPDRFLFPARVQAHILKRRRCRGAIIGVAEQLSSERGIE